MKLALLSFLGSVFVGAVNTAVWCVPGECRVDSNCIDSIHSVSGKCCGGVCTRAGDRQRFVGEQCAPRDLSHADNYERCFADCGSGLFCNTVDERCHAKHGPGCPCLADRECLSNMCRGSHVCSGENLPFGEACELNNECSSNYCSEQTKKCSALAIGEACNSFGGVPCVPDAVCRRNTTAFSTYCLSPCAAGAADCCYDGSSVCAKTPANLVCDSGNYSCYVNTPPGLGEACPLGLCSNSTTMVCATECNGGGCGTVRVCQLRNQLAVGTPCEVTSQCVVGALCQYNFANFTYECALLPTNAPSGAPTSAPTAALNSVPLGQPCGDPENFNLCMAPGNMCEANETGTFVCKQSGTTPIGAFCSISSVSLSVRAIDECVKGSRCTKNATNFGAGSFACRTPIPIGQRCYSTSASQIFNTPMCENGFDNCAMTGRNCYSCDYNDVSGNPCCTCVAPRTVADGKNCSAHSQCQKATSLCHPNNYTCVNIQGIDCITPSNCLDSSFDCNCDRKCYLLNAPTPAQISHAPTASTRAPSPYTPRCDAQQKAWNALPASSSFYFTSFPRLSYATFHEQFLPRALLLTEANQAILIAYICCETCYWNDRFNSHIYASYQVDCGAKKLIKLEDTCDDLRAPWALANCWGALSAAPSLDMGFALVATLLVVFF